MVESDRVRRCLAIFLLALALPAAAAGVDVHFLWREGCPHCERERAFLDRVAAANPAVRVHKREVGERCNAALMVRTAQERGLGDDTAPPHPARASSSTYPGLRPKASRDVGDDQ